MRGLAAWIALMIGPFLIAQPAQPPRAEFSATNASRSWAVTAEITGTAVFDGDTLRIMVNKCGLSRAQRFPDAENVVSIVAGISRTRPSDSWEILRRSVPHSIHQSLDPGTQAALPPFELTVPLDDFAIEEGDRLTFEIFGTLVRDGAKRGGHIPLQARIQWPEAVVLPRHIGLLPAALFRSYADAVVSPIDGEVRGRISLESGVLKVAIDKLGLTSSPEYPDEGRRIENIQVAMVRTVENTMAILATGEMHKAEPGPFELKLPLPNGSKDPTDRIVLKVVSVTSEGAEEDTYLHVPFALP
jgi:hypothetical protein